ncbi:tetratricopeptide repeat protein [Arthrobacter tumbae]|uniref:tetratricopeptide repeat protein n=1 Tax=Arthrobacter tumbae TaxID=163874 RepID=UPI00195EFA93|nr:tetratricopeptide repeat protein [Arthrobacter tumbae]
MSRVIYGAWLPRHSVGRKDEALRITIEAKTETLPRHQRSMRIYAAALTESAASGNPTTR